MEEHISDIQFRKLFDGQILPDKGGLSSALLHVLRCGSCRERFVDIYAHPAPDPQYDEIFDRLERRLSEHLRRFKTALEM